MIIESDGVAVLMIGDVVLTRDGTVATVRDVREVLSTARSHRADGQHAYRKLDFPFMVRIGWFEDTCFKQDIVWLDSLRLIRRD